MNTIIAPIEYAGFWKRVLALLIDDFFLISILFLVSLLLPDDILPYIASITFIGYFTYFHSSKHQATFGKMAMKIVVVAKKDFNRITTVKSFLREISQTVLVIPNILFSHNEILSQVIGLLLFIAWYVPAAITQEKTALHDLLADTRVVKLKGLNL